MKKTKHLIVRITPEQLRELTIHLENDDLTKSELIRGLLDRYLNNCSPDNKKKCYSLDPNNNDKV